MVRINDPKAVWRAIGQHGTPPPVSRPALAAAIFGPHPERWVARPESMVHGFPIPLADLDARPQLIACTRGPPRAEPCASVTVLDSPRLRHVPDLEPVLEHLPTLLRGVG